MKLPQMRARVHQSKGEPGDIVTIHGVPCEVVSDADAELSDCVVCVPVSTPLIFPDNLTGPCVGCGAPLQWRHHAPKKPPRLCMPCAVIQIKTDHGS
jgi:hypothetical protein